MLSSKPALTLSLPFLLMTIVGCPDKQSNSPKETVPDEAESKAPVEKGAPSLMITANGYGLYQIGATLEQTGLSLERNDLPGGNECGYARLGGNGSEILFMIVRNQLARIDLTNTDMKMANGLGIGSSGADIKAAYADRVKVLTGKYDETVFDYQVTLSKTRGAVFRVKDDKVTHFRIGRLPEVFWVEGCS